MLQYEDKLKILDILTTIVFFSCGCVLGKVSMNHFGDFWIAFYGPALGILAICEFIWFFIRRVLKKKWQEDSSK